MLNKKALEAAARAFVSTGGNPSIETIIQAYLDALPPREVTDEMVWRAMRAFCEDEKEIALLEEAKAENDEGYVLFEKSMRTALQAALGEQADD